MRVPVLIVGGGTVGLSAALFLAEHGIHALVVERHPGPSEHPRAGGVNYRTLELFRAAGLEDALRAETAKLADNRGVIAVDTLAGSDLSQVPKKAVPNHAMPDLDMLTPTEDIGGCPQNRLDPVLLDAARRGGATVLFGSELVDLDAHATPVRATLADGRVVHADYLIAADGAHSRIRDQLGIGRTGPGDLGNHRINVMFRADLRHVTRGTTFALCRITDPESPGVLVPVDDTRWLFHIAYEPESLRDYTPRRCRDLIRTAVGVPDLDVEVLSTRPWQSAASTADRFRAGRVFLVGDAAHVVPPVGGFGLNTGIADAHNLAWKLAVVIEGTAGTALLDSYEAERRPVALSTMEQSLTRGRNQELHWDVSPQRAVDRARLGMLSLPVLVFGYQYDSAAIVRPRVELPSTERAELCLDGSPGSRLPHVWLDRRTSSLDLVRSRFTLLTGPAGDSWRAAADVAAGKYGITVRCHSLQQHAAFGIDDEGAVLVRPDDFVAWRARGRRPEPERELLTALGQILHATP